MAPARAAPAVLRPLATERVDPCEPAGDGDRFRYFPPPWRGRDVRLAGFQRADGTLSDLAISVGADVPLNATATEELIEDLGPALEDLRRLSR